MSSDFEPVGIVAEEGGSEGIVSWSPEELFSGNWADEVEKEETEPISASNSTAIRPNNAKKHKKKKKPKKKKKNVQYKLFVGGIIFADLEERLFEMEEAIGEEVEPEILFAACDTLKKLRIDCLESMFEEFGKVVQIKANWGKRFCHVAYERQEDALEAFRVLARVEERKKRQKEFKDLLAAAGFPRFAAPNFNFYVRWPRGSPPLEGNGAISVGTLPEPPLIDDDNGGAEDRISYWALATSAGAEWEVLNRTPRNDPFVGGSSVASTPKTKASSLLGTSGVSPNLLIVNTATAVHNLSYAA